MCSVWPGGALATPSLSKKKKNYCAFLTNGHLPYHGAACSVVVKLLDLDLQGRWLVWS